MLLAQRPGVTSTDPDDPRLARYQGLIFDCDGTLTDSMPVHYHAWAAAMEAVGIDFPEDRFYQMGGIPTVKIIQTLAREQSVRLDIQAAAVDKEQRFLAIADDVVAMPPVLQIADRFRGRIPMAVASGGTRKSVGQQLRRIDRADWFAAVVTAEDTEKHKPNPDVFLEAAGQLNVPANRCLVFEDSHLGVEAAGRAAMDCVLIDREQKLWLIDAVAAATWNDSPTAVT